MWKGALLGVVSIHVPLTSGDTDESVDAAFRSLLRVAFGEVVDEGDGPIAVEAVVPVGLRHVYREKLYLRSVRELESIGDGHGGVGEVSCSNQSHVV
jgi:hypothetical protein